MQVVDELAQRACGAGGAGQGAWGAGVPQAGRLASVRSPCLSNRKQKTNF